MRYDEYDEFVSFFNVFLLLKDSEYNNILEKIHKFKIFLETTVRLITDSSELKNKLLHINRTEKLLKKYLFNGGG